MVEADPGTGKMPHHYFDAPDEPCKVWRFGKKAAGRRLDGRLHTEFPI